MKSSSDINNISLFIASILVFVSMYISYSQKLKLERETFIAALRAVLQLGAVGYVLEFIFGLESPLFTTLLVIVMIFNAAVNAAKRGSGIHNGLLISFLSIFLGTAITLGVLVASGAITYNAYNVVPVSGMIIGNSMVALGLCYRKMISDFKDKRDMVETKLALGADIYASSIDIIRDSLRTGMHPTIDSAKTLGIVSLPGMMTGLIFAGVSPLSAIKYQIMVTFMLISTTSISSLFACYMAYRRFFNERKQLV